MKNKYVEKAFNEVVARNPHEEQFLNTVKEVFTSLEPVYDAHPELEKEKYLERIAEPQRVVQFQVKWVDDNGETQVNRGYRVQQNNAIGPFKGGLRFNKTVNLSILKSLAFEQTFKNALTGCPMGGGKGGSDFDPHGKSPAEIDRFCHAFMEKLYPYIGSTTDVPAGDLGVGGTEIGHLLDEYLKHRSDIGTLTGKPLDKGGLLGRTEATGFGLCYFTDEMLKDHGKTFKGAKVIISGSGNVSTYACKKGIQGMVINGAVRDIKALNCMENFICYALAVSPNGPYKKAPGSINVPVDIQGKTINPGDLIISDEDGVIAISKEDIQSSLDKALAMKEREETLINMARNGINPRPVTAKMLEEVGCIINR